MANPYESGKGDPKGLEDAILGPHAYSYYDKINTPKHMGMSAEGSWDALTNDVAGLLAYYKVLAKGEGEASNPEGPLGNKYFLQTSAKCFDSSGAQVPRYIYINNIPDGTIPLISGDSGIDLGSKFEGLIPGVIEDILRLNPMNLFQAFVTGSKPACTAITMPVGDAGKPGVSNPDCPKESNFCETHHVLDVEIKNMNSKWFPSQYPKPKISEGFVTRSAAEIEVNKDISEMPSDPIVKLWYGALGLLGLYILAKLFIRKQ